MDETTLVAWDDTPSAAAALDWALEREAIRGGTVCLVHVIDEHGRRHDHDLHRATAAVDAAAERARTAAPGRSVTTIVRLGDPLDELLRASDSDSVLAVGTHPRGRRLRLGWSIGARLAASAAGPVAIVPLEPATGRTGVVAGFDGTPESIAALDFAAEEAALRRQHLHVVHAWIEPLLLEGQPAVHPQLVELLEDESRQILAGAVERLARDHPTLAIEAHSVHGTPATALLRAGETASLIVVGNRGLVGIRRILLGSVSHEVVVGIDCPTIVVGRGAHATDVA
jgi:nucleotide-binding universal stress UspA family protein